MLSHWLEGLTVTPEAYLNSRVGDTDRIKHLVEVVRYQTVAGPLREESEGDDDPQTLPVTSGDKE